MRLPFFKPSFSPQVNFCIRKVKADGLFCNDCRGYFTPRSLPQKFAHRVG